MLNELVVNKFNCRDCGKTVKVNGVEDIIRFNKTCAECRVIDITGGRENRFTKPVKENKVLIRKTKPEREAKVFADNSNFSLTRKETMKKSKKKKMSPEQRRRAKQAWDDKWDRECENRRMSDYRKKII
jgi:hypothetical protein